MLKRSPIGWLLLPLLLSCASKSPPAPVDTTDIVAVDTVPDPGTPGPTDTVQDIVEDMDRPTRDIQKPDTTPPEPTCPPEVICVDSFPFTHTDNTALSGHDGFDSYSCKPETDESGPEVLYQVTVPTDGFLSAAVYDESGVDIDVHILSVLDPDACLARGHHHASVDVSVGTYYVVADTFVSDGTDLSGSYEIDIGFTQPSHGPCELEVGIMKRVGDGGDHLAMPATGPMVMEAHLVTQEEPAPFPSTSTEELVEHYLLSQSVTGFVMYRQQHWAPLEGGSFYGAGIGPASLLPVVDEGWYVNMYWASANRPPRGTRMILKDPDSGRAVVVSAGHETGPGNLANIGGTGEETHHYLGTGHKSVLTLGIAVDQDLPFGPRTCQ